MRGKSDFQTLLAAAVLIIAGTLSPSNGVDDRSYKTPAELLTTVFRIVISCLAAYLIWTFIEDYKKISK